MPHLTRLSVIARVLASLGLAAILVAACGGCGERRGATDPPPPTEWLARERACADDAECVHLGDFCRGGCAITVNRRYETEVRERLSSSNETCNIDCPPVSAPVCRAGLCDSPSR